MSIRGEVKSHREVANTTHTHHTPHQDGVTLSTVVLRTKCVLKIRNIRWLFKKT